MTKLYRIGAVIQGAPCVKGVITSMAHRVGRAASLLNDNLTNASVLSQHHPWATTPSADLVRTRIICGNITISTALSAAPLTSPATARSTATRGLQKGNVTVRAATCAGQGHGQRHHDHRGSQRPPADPVDTPKCSL